jgi:hypothetical protein
MCASVHLLVAKWRPPNTQVERGDDIADAITGDMREELMELLRIMGEQEQSLVVVPIAVASGCCGCRGCRFYCRYG